MHTPAKDGRSARDHYDGSVERARKSYGEWSHEFEDAVQKLDEIRGPLWDESLDYLRAWFFELHAAREYDSVSGACAITYVQVQAWASLTGRSPDPVEVRALMALDRAWRSPDAKGG